MLPIVREPMEVVVGDEELAELDEPFAFPNDQSAEPTAEKVDSVDGQEDQPGLGQPDSPVNDDPEAAVPAEGIPSPIYATDEVAGDKAVAEAENAKTLPFLDGPKRGEFYTCQDDEFDLRELDEGWDGPNDEAGNAKTTLTTYRRVERDGKEYWSHAV